MRINLGSPPFLIRNSDIDGRVTENTAAEVSFDKQKISTATKEDLEQNTTDILASEHTKNDGCPTASVQC